MKDFEELMTFSPSSHFCLFTYYCSNLGDHIQTLALLQHLTPRMLVPRDHLTPQKDLFLFANGWLTEGNLPDKQDFRNIKYVGVHITPQQRNINTVNAMKQCGVIGCRDTATANFLAKDDVPHYLTRCATLTFPPYSGKREGIYCVDVPTEIKEKVRQFYKDALCVSHDLDDLSLDQVNDEIITNQYKKAYEFLMQYRKAELVITSRLHATLPCVAFGTPVIYVGVPKSLDDRVSVLDGMGVKVIDGTLRVPSWDLRQPSLTDASQFRERYLEFLQQCIADVLKC